MEEEKQRGDGKIKISNFLDNFISNLQLETEICLPSEYVVANNKKVEEDVKTNSQTQYYSAEKGRSLDNFKQKLKKGLMAENLIRYISGLPPTSKSHEPQYYTPPDISIENKKIEIKSLEINNNSSYKNGWATDTSVLSNNTPMILISSDMASSRENKYSISIDDNTSKMLWPYTDTRKVFFYFYIPSDGYIDVGDKSVGGAVQNPNKIIFVPKAHKKIEKWIEYIQSDINPVGHPLSSEIIKEFGGQRI